ncbi:MAG: hypothetical protein FJX75_12525 [Armatimonadetes bacterium]|nr:hypothetical protein [Armatimonadota bacterium]
MASRARVVPESQGAVALEVEAPSARDLEARMEALEEQLDQLHNNMHRMLADLEIRIVDGYIVKAWLDVETGEWVAECPKVGAAVQEPSRDEALDAIGTMIAEMLQVKHEFGDPVPPRDV